MLPQIPGKQDPRHLRAFLCGRIRSDKDLDSVPQTMRSKSRHLRPWPVAAYPRLSSPVPQAAYRLSEHAHSRWSIAPHFKGVTVRFYVEFDNLQGELFPVYL